MSIKTMINGLVHLIMKILCGLGLGGISVNLLLKLHRISYRLAGNFGALMEDNGLHPKHRLMKYHQWFMSKLEKEWVVLDIGCGNGALAFQLKSCCKKVIAIDINPAN